MTSPLLSSLAATIGSAMSGLFLDATLTRETVTAPTDSFDPSTGAKTTATYACKAIHEDYGIGYKQAGLVESQDRKVMILATSLSVTPAPGDRITIRSESFTIVPADTKGQGAVTTDPAKAVWTCRCRA